MREIEAAEELLLTPSQMQINRWYYEQEKLRLFPSFVLLRSNNLIAAAVGAIDTQKSNTYRVRIELNNYPHALPKILPLDWTIHPECPHKFSDGSICIMRSDQWRKHFTIALVIAKVSVWLAKYELWKRNGHIWPGLGQKH